MSHAEITFTSKKTGGERGGGGKSLGGGKAMKGMEKEGKTTLLHAKGRSRGAEETPRQEASTAEVSRAFRLFNQAERREGWRD